MSEQLTLYDCPRHGPQQEAVRPTSERRWLCFKCGQECRPVEYQRVTVEPELLAWEQEGGSLQAASASAGIDTEKDLREQLCICVEEIERLEQRLAEVEPDQIHEQLKTAQVEIGGLRAALHKLRDPLIYPSSPGKAARWASHVASTALEEKDILRPTITGDDAVHGDQKVQGEGDQIRIDFPDDGMRTGPTETVWIWFCTNDGCAHRVSSVTDDEFDHDPHEQYLHGRCDVCEALLEKAEYHLDHLIYPGQQRSREELEAEICAQVQADCGQLRDFIRSQ